MIADLLTLVPSVLQGIEIAWTWRRGALALDKAQMDGLHEVQELALRVSGSILFEMRSNIERVRLVRESASAGSVTFAPFDLSVSDALLKTFCEVSPTPAVLREYYLALSSIRRVDFFQRLAGSAPPIIADDGILGPRAQDDARHYGKAIGFAEDAINKGLIERFNALVKLCDGIGQAVLKEAWPGVRLTFIPAAIDPRAPVDHTLL